MLRSTFNLVAWGFQAFSDTMMFRCIDESANLFRKFNENPTYYYHYAHRGGLGLPSLLGITKDLGMS